MGKQRYERIKKTLSVLLLVSFIIFVTDASASAKQINVPRNYQTGYHKVPRTATKSATIMVMKTASNMAKKGF